MHKALKSTLRHVRVCACSQASGVFDWACRVPRWVYWFCQHGTCDRRCVPPAADISDAGGSSYRHRSAEPTGGGSGDCKRNPQGSCLHVQQASRAASRPSRSTRTCWLTFTTERLPPMSWSKAWDLFVQQKAQDKFKRTFCLSWKEALDQGLVYNLVDNPELGRPMSELGAEHDKLEKCETMLRSRGGFHCRKIEGARYQRPLHVHTWAVHRAWHGHLFTTVRVECG